MAQGIQPRDVLRLMAGVLAGIEAAHGESVIHRDLKPENIFYDAGENALVVGDFGIAHFSEEYLHTFVDTRPGERLANYQYAAPEQATPGSTVDQRADIYALGLILNEMFTGSRTLGTDFKKIGDVYYDYAYVDELVDQMLRNDPDGRPASISVVRMDLNVKREIFHASREISELTKATIPESDDDILIMDPPRLVGFDYKNGQLHLEMSRGVSPEWIKGFDRIGTRSSVPGSDIGDFAFSGNIAIVSARYDRAQEVVDYFKGYLRLAKNVYEQAKRVRLDNEKRLIESQRRAEIVLEEQRIEVLRTVKIDS